MTTKLAVLCIGMQLCAWLPGIAFAADPGQATMPAIRIHAFGGPEVLQLESMPRPAPGPGELLVRVRAAAINPVDTGVRAGELQDLADAQLPYVPGYDLSGVVIETGAGATRFAPGDEIFAMLDLRRGGAYAEYAIVRDDEAAKKPAALSHAEAASLPLVALTAWQALVETAGLKPGQTVLIHAGAGGVGSIAIQLAKLHGARVITTASKDNHDFLRSLGADRVVDYRTQRFEDAAHEVDVVLDTIGGETQDRSLAMLREGGILVGLVGLTPAARAAGPGKRAIAILVRPDSEQLSRIRSLVDSGQLHPIVSHLLPLQHAAEAHRLSETRRTRGKIVLDMDAGIRAAALAYIEGWYAGDEERMAQSLHPDLVKRIVERSPGEARIDEMTAAQLIAATGSGYGRETPTDQRRTEIKVLDVFGEVASVRVDAGEWIDYMHLARFDGDWKILNVLWELR
jgi:NADPH:quinone reductase-like Zn-dependent oxidoreductase